MTDTLDTMNYFASPIYSIMKPEFLETVRTASNNSLSKMRKQTKVDEIYPVLQTDISGEETLKEFFDYVINTAWNLLSGQGYDMQNRSTTFTEIWCQEHKKYSSMEYHLHSDSQMVVFYVLECPEDPPRIVFHDPRPGRIMSSLPEANVNVLTEASSAVNFVPVPGMLMFANSWLPHSFTRNPSSKPFKFVHMNINTILRQQVDYPATAEIV